MLHSFWIEFDPTRPLILRVRAVDLQENFRHHLKGHIRGDKNVLFRMRTLLFDPFHGASGDMITAALLQLGADRSAALRAMAAVVKEPLIEETERGGIRALRVRTRAEARPRSLEEVMGRLRGADGPAAAIAMAERVILRLHRAEEEVHGPVVHFHEVGADDAIADIVGACTALHSLAVEQVAVLPIALGGGFIRGSHGTLPVPAPATAAILSASNLQGHPGPDEGELLTPTGAALLAEFATLPASRLPPGKILSVGYGAGSTGDRSGPEPPPGLSHGGRGAPV